jgi:hypothetical protein
LLVTSNASQVTPDAEANLADRTVAWMHELSTIVANAKVMHTCMHAGCYKATACTVLSEIQALVRFTHDIDNPPALGHVLHLVSPSVSRFHGLLERPSLRRCKRQRAMVHTEQFLFHRTNSRKPLDNDAPTLTK